MWIGLGGKGTKTAKALAVSQTAERGRIHFLTKVTKVLSVSTTRGRDCSFPGEHIKKKSTQIGKPQRGWRSDGHTDRKDGLPKDRLMRNNVIPLQGGCPVSLTEYQSRKRKSLSPLDCRRKGGRTKIGPMGVPITAIWLTLR